MSGQECGTCGCGFRLFVSQYKIEKFLTVGQNMRLVFRVWKCDSPAQLRNGNLGGWPLSVLSPSGVWGRPVQSASTVLGAGGAMVSRTEQLLSSRV